jgi:pilus assembly protein Flp/PilA
MKELLRKLAADETGQDLIEYALVAALIALGAVSALKGVKNAIASDFNDEGNQLTNAT